MMELPDNNIEVIRPIFKYLKENMVMRKKYLEINIYA